MTLNEPSISDTSQDRLENMSLRFAGTTVVLQISQQPTPNRTCGSEIYNGRAAARMTTHFDPSIDHLTALADIRMSTAPRDARP